MNAVSDLVLLGRVGASLVVVIVLAALVARLARKASVRGPGAGLRVLDRVGVTRDGAVAVVQVGERALVVGVTAHQVTLLTEVSAHELAAAPVTGSAVTRTAVAGTTTTTSSRKASGSVLDMRTWQQGLDALRERTVRR